MDQKSKFCAQCQKQTLWARPETNFFLHMLLTLVSCGLWLPIWILVSTGGWRCQTCGSDGLEDLSEECHDHDDDQRFMGRVKGGLICGAISGFIGIMLACGGSPETGLAFFVFFGVFGLLLGAAFGPYYEKYYG